MCSKKNISGHGQRDDRQSLLMISVLLPLGLFAADLVLKEHQASLGILADALFPDRTISSYYYQPPSGETNLTKRHIFPAGIELTGSGCKNELRGDQALGRRDSCM